MRTLLSMVLVAVVTVATAQEKRGRMHSDLTPEQKAELHTKRMALALDLNEGQQKELLQLSKEQSKKRQQQMEAHRAMKEKGETLSSEERYKRMNAQLDEKLEMQKRMKKILNEDQYRQWRKMGAERTKRNVALRKQHMRMQMQRQKRW